MSGWVVLLRTVEDCCHCGDLVQAIPDWGCDLTHVGSTDASPVIQESSLVMSSFYEFQQIGLVELMSTPGE